METAKGILLIALGMHQYGNYAANLCASIKGIYNLPVALAYGGDAINHIKRDGRIKLFDHLIEVPKEYYYTEDKPTYIKAKNYMYFLSPFERTLFLDVDMVLFPRNDTNKHDGIDKFFEEVKDIDFTMANRDFIELSDSENHQEYSIWANIHQAKQAFGIEDGRYYSCHSEWVYFKKCDKVKEFFDDVIMIVESFKDVKPNQSDNPRRKAVCEINGINVEMTEFGNGVPDELPFALSMAKNKLYPHATPFIKIYWETAEKRGLVYGKLPIAYKEYLGLSLGGNIVDKGSIKSYNDLVSSACRKRGVKHFPYMNKIQFASGRTKF